ncbi:MAG: PASTA domain-containing protein [Clostridia bacterium]|nr:PASTA domain-containing protein [Clostridia bacterium]
MGEQTPRRNPSEDAPVHPKTTKRAGWLLLLMVAMLSFLLIRILLYQTVQYDTYRQKVIDQVTTESQVNATRGNIYDRNGVLLATNVSTYRVFISPSSIAKEQSNYNQTDVNIQLDTLIAEHLSNILEVDYEFVLKQTTYTKYLDRTIKKEVDEDTADRVREVIDAYGLEQMVYLQTTTTRYYPYSTLASHVLGFTGSDGTGLYGLEYSYNQLLSGTNGRYITARDAQGNEMPTPYKEYIAAEDGYHIHTTLDVFVQSALEEQVKAAYLNSNAQNRAAGIVMNVNTGEILGMATYPSFDLNDPWSLDADSAKELQASGYVQGTEGYAKLKQELLLDMWSNKAITESYIPGSTFKIITAAMALEEGVVSLEDTFHCTGALTWQEFHTTIHCHKLKGHGTLTFVQGIQQSCNPVLMTVGHRLGTSTFYSYLKAFGYMQKTGVDLSGEGNSIFAAEPAFTGLDLVIYSFGQNFNVTLMQQITAVSAVANGGYLVTPYLVSSVTDGNGSVLQKTDANIRRQVVSAQVCKTVSKILEGGVSGDGGAKNAYVAGYRVAAKTGTSEKKNAGSIEEYICSTVAYAPADNPQYAVIIIVDEPKSGVLYGSVVAAPYVGRVMETVLPYLDVEAVYSEAELAKMAVKTPDVTYWSASLAERTCKSYGFKVRIVGDPEGVVYKQYPAPETVVEKESATIILYTDRASEPEMITVPNLIGKSALAANQELTNQGLNIRIKGAPSYLSGTQATVVSQSVAAGTQVPKGTVIEVTFLYLEDSD